MKFRPYAIAFVFFAAFSARAAQTKTEHGHVSRTQSSLVFERFSRLNVPADAAAVSRAFGDSTWLNQAAISHMTWMAGWSPMKHNLSPPGGVFVVDLNPPKSQHIAGFVIYLHTTADFAEARGKPDAANVLALRRLIAGNAARNIKIDEFALCYPDGRILHVQRDSRKVMGPFW